MKMPPFSLCIRGRLYRFDYPLVAGILNATPDSFYSGSRTDSVYEKMKAKAEIIAQEGADIIDVGAYSSRPGASEVSEAEETERLCNAIRAVKDSSACELPISVDTFRSRVAKIAVEEFGADIINDIGGGTLDNEMFSTIAALQVPYVLMHMRGTPATMQNQCDYSPDGVVASVIGDLSLKIEELAQLGVNDIIIDPGFGFAKTVEQNYDLLAHLPEMIKILRRPVLVGVSRKSMLTKTLGVTPEEALNATTAANMAALERGASILRVHDVKAAREVVKIKMLIDNK